jgi:hypothetical protein
MKLDHITTSDLNLFESIDKINDTEFLTKDLVRLIKEEENTNWTSPMSGEAALTYLRSL